MDTSKLAPETLRVWQFLSTHGALRGFILIGGTALTMHLAHRVSEDLDLITVAPKLHRVALEGLVRDLEQHGFVVVRDDYGPAYEEFLIAGQSLHDYQQNFLINGVKVNIFAADADLSGMVEASNDPIVRVASLPELFRMKALAAANRSVSRDWLDLYILFRHQGFSLADFDHAFRHPGIHNPAQRIVQAFQNLCRGVKAPTDPGYATLMPDAPSVEELGRFFSMLRGEYETAQARASFEEN